jgi:hypothetical protein
LLNIAVPHQLHSELLREPRPPRAKGAFDRPSKSVGWMRRLEGALLLAALGASGPWRAAAVVVPPVTVTNRMSLTWGLLGPGTQYYVQTSTNLLTWTAATSVPAIGAGTSPASDGRLNVSGHRPAGLRLPRTVSENPAITERHNQHERKSPRNLQF